MISKLLKIKRIFLAVLLLVVSLFPAMAPAQEPGLAESYFANVMDGILAHSCLRKQNFGVNIYSLDQDETLYSFQGDRLFAPASNMKLLTTATALKRMGPDYRFKTRLFATMRVAKEALEGDLYIKGFGDPNLVSEQMWLLANELRNLPLSKVNGDIVADDSFFDDRLRIKTWKKKGGAEAYNAPLGALSFNFNTVTVHVSPGEKPGDRPVVVVDPDIDFIQVENRAKTVSRSRRSRLIVNRVGQGDHNEITVSGVISVSHSRETYYLNITQPTYYAAKVFKEFLRRAGVEVTGKVRIGPVPEEAYDLSSHTSVPLSLVLRGLNKFSNNFVAEQILKTIGAELYGQPGTTENGLRAVGEYMQSLGHESGQFRVLDGSGLSRQNRLSPDQIVSVLRDMHGDLGVYPEFVSALGVMGRDGNVLKRMNGYNGSERARVKTGTLNFVSALSGYFQSAGGERFAFSILMNDLKCSNERAWSLQDRIVREGLKFERETHGTGLD
ncbi:MAG: D-alanyl-D-alanine carboxypeptidase/D-alanyl-D-alanine-endopeptidase [Nitrospinae bacterium]|nr:D-alanyl-D-alanine carboxypeptidase/D-alanyl-D-alanine-endopeptidase [Nitrospinota bacterium]